MSFATSAFWMVLLTLGVVAACLVGGLVPNAMNNARKGDITRLNLEIGVLEASIAALEAQLLNISLTPGPPGPTGPTGTTGPPGPGTPSARLNIAAGTGLAGGQALRTTDPDPAYVNLTNVPLTVLEYNSLNGSVVLENDYELVVHTTGHYSFTIYMGVITNGTGSVMFQFMIGPAYYIGGDGVIVTCTCVPDGDPIPWLAPYFPDVCAATCASNTALTAGDRVRLVYATTIDAEIVPSSGVSVTKLD